MAEKVTIGNATLYHGDCREVLPAIEAAELWVCANCAEPEIENTILIALQLAAAPPAHYGWMRAALESAFPNGVPAQGNCSETPNSSFIQSSAEDARLAKFVVELAKRQVHFEPDIAEIIAEEWDRLFDDDAAVQSSAGGGNG